MFQRPLVVLGLEPQIPLDVDEEPRRLPADIGPNPLDVLLDQVELLFWVWSKKESVFARISPEKTRITFARSENVEANHLPHPEKRPVISRPIRGKQAPHCAHD
jgi:hypothetical protein